MFKLFIRYLTQVLIVSAPMFTSRWSLLNLLGHTDAGDADPVVLSVLGLTTLEGPKQELELTIRLCLSGFALALTAAYEAWDVYLPVIRLRDFRRTYFEATLREWREKLSSEIRINIMYARRPWYTLWLIPFFEWTFNDGFSPGQGHIDANMNLACFQGVCGKAYRTQEAQSVYFFGTPSNLTFAQKYLLRKPISSNTLADETNPPPEGYR